MLLETNFVKCWPEQKQSHFQSLITPLSSDLRYYHLLGISPMLVGYILSYNHLEYSLVRLGQLEATSVHHWDIR